MNRRLAAIVIAGVTWGLATHPSAAQGQTASLDGRVTDEQDGALVGATVAAVSSLLPRPEIAITDGVGAYRFTSLPAGVYTVTVGIAGFQTHYHEGLVLRAGSVRVLNVSLALAPLSQQVDVVGVAPALGGGVSRDRLPAAIAVIEADEFEARRAASLAAALHERLGAVSLSDATSNVFQPTLHFRGFTASPLLGLPQGVVVYQNGARLNEPFGDTVQFDLIPQFALERVQLSAGVEPTYGLNALGGALALQLKNGFDVDGVRGEFVGGSFERFSGTAEVGAHSGPWAVYMGGTRFDETGWRVASESTVTQAVADLAYRTIRVDAGMSFIHADTALNGNGPAPIELLDADRSAVFTFPDTTENQLKFWQTRFNFVVSPTLIIQANGYYRDLDRRTLNGDEAEFVPCQINDRPQGAPADTLCRGVGDDDNDEPVSIAAPIVDVLTGRFITTRDTAGDGAFNRSFTGSKGYGATVQATSTASLLGLDNVLVLGVSADLADVSFASNSEVGTLTATRTVDGSGQLAGIYGRAPDDEFNTAIDIENRTFGLYFSNTVSLTDRVHVTLAGRYNEARIDITDLLGTSLDGRHAFSRFNPSIGAVYQLSSKLALFARYSESNRAPTAAELSCADPSEPCRVPNAFVSDPPLEPPVARSVEGGARGQAGSAGPWALTWSLTGYRTRIQDDILFVASSELIGAGFFQNAGDTQRAGIDFELNGTAGRASWYAGYGLVESTFESPLRLPSSQAVNDAASKDGEIKVWPGDRLPGIPRHGLKGGVRYELTNAWDVTIDTIFTSSQVFRGDEGNDQVELDGLGTIGLRSVYRLNEHLDFFVRVDNLFDADYSTFGALASVEIELEEAPSASDPRFVTPGALRSAFGGFRLRF